MRQGVIHCLGIVVLASGVYAHAADDAYLKMLEGEAESLELDQQGQLKSDTAADSVRTKKLQRKGMLFEWKGQLENENLPSGMAQQEFEAVLQDNFYGTFLFYERLNSADKQTVYYRYTKAESVNLENVRKDILELMKR